MTITISLLGIFPDPEAVANEVGTELAKKKKLSSIARFVAFNRRGLVWITARPSDEKTIVGVLSSLRHHCQIERNSP